MAVDKDLLVVMNTIDDTKNHMSEGQYIKTCDSIKRIHKKLSRPRVPVPRIFNAHLSLKALYMFSYAVSVVKIVEGIKKAVTR
jgi:hypothetical protein